MPRGLEESFRLKAVHRSAESQSECSVQGRSVKCTNDMGCSVSWCGAAEAEAIRAKSSGCRKTGLCVNPSVCRIPRAGFQSCRLVLFFVVLWFSLLKNVTLLRLFFKNLRHDSRGFLCFFFF